MSIVNGNEDGTSSGKTPSRDDYRHGKLVIKAGMLPADSEWRVVIYSKMAHLCIIDLKIQPSNI